MWYSSSRTVLGLAPAPAPTGSATWGNACLFVLYFFPWQNGVGVMIKWVELHKSLRNVIQVKCYKSLWNYYIIIGARGTQIFQLQQMLGRMWIHWNFCTLLLEYKMEQPLCQTVWSFLKMWNREFLKKVVPLTRIYLKEFKKVSPKTHTHIHRSTIHNHQKADGLGWRSLFLRQRNLNPHLLLASYIRMCPVCSICSTFCYLTWLHLR